MAQYWVRTDSKDPFTEDFPVAISSSIVDDGGDNVYRVTSSSNSQYFGSSLTAVGTADLLDGTAEVMALVRQGGSTNFRGSGVSLFLTSLANISNQVETRRSGTTHFARAGGTTLITGVASLATVTAYHWVSLRLTTAKLVELRVWAGGIDDAVNRPATANESADTSAQTFDAAGVIGLFGYLNSGNTYFCKAISVGTAGDPAPTGPVAGTVAPTLSAPGVIDVTDTSARPQVTLTF